MATKRAESGDGNRSLKVGELARLTGLTVRTLHHYDETGLLSPSLRTAAGHRLYTRTDIARLHQIRALRALGVPLVQIKELLDSSGMTLRDVVHLQLDRQRERIAVERRMLARLEALDAMLASAGDLPVDAMVATIEEMTKMEKYYSKEQLDVLEKRGAELGAQRLADAAAEWETLMAEVRRHMKLGTDPGSDDVRALAKRWMEKVREFTGGDAGIARSVGQVWQQEENVHGIDTSEMREMMAYIQRAGGGQGE